MNNESFSKVTFPILTPLLPS